MPISAGAGAIGAGAIGAVSSAWGQSKQNSANRREAKHQRDWQKGMSDTAHRREVADLKLAGLNPILSATGGSGASTGSSGLPQIGNVGKAAIEGSKGGLAVASAKAMAAISRNAERRDQDKQDYWDANKATIVPLATYKDTGVTDPTAIGGSAVNAAKDLAKPKSAWTRAIQGFQSKYGLYSAKTIRAMREFNEQNRRSGKEKVKRFDANKRNITTPEGRKIRVNQ